ncbi:MAG: YdiU family protein [Planctomycetes bacterium]|nr:YdiU family protein [Planctomycetota bacterium]
MMGIQFDNSYARLPEGFWSKGKVWGAPDPGWIEVNEGLCGELGLDLDWVRSEEGFAMFSGNRFPESAEPLAMAYAGHQFSGFSPQLGDGRALLIGEVLDPGGKRWDLRLKGSGRTRLSRGGDGKATVEAIVREYLVSEGMHGLGIPTTRALAAVTTGERIWREQGQLPGAILCRVARSHVRVGTFQYFAVRGETESVRTLADYVIDRHYPEARDADGSPYVAMLHNIVERQAQLVARWMQVGFIHGVMNTDNMQVLGETLDYGPCAFMDEFDPAQVFSMIDVRGRYAWDQQANMAHWGLIRLIEALASVLSENHEELQAIATVASAHFSKHFEEAFLTGFRQKLGLLEPREDDATFLQTAFSAMAQNKVDFTLFFRHLTRIAAGHAPTEFESLFPAPEPAQTWLETWRTRTESESTSPEQRASAMTQTNPIFIPRNHRVEEAIQAALTGDYQPFHELARILATPYQEQPDSAAYENAPTESERVCQTHCNT